MEESRYDIEISRGNWKVLGIILMILICGFVTSCISYSIGRIELREDILNSGYSITEVNTISNTYYIINYQHPKGCEIQLNSP